MKRLALIALTAAACSKSSEPSATTENGVRVNYVTEPATCILSGSDKDMCSMDPGTIRGGVKQNAWACSTGTTKTGGSSVEHTCWTSLTVCNEAVKAVREAVAAGDAVAAEITSVGDCEIYRVKAR